MSPRAITALVCASALVSCQAIFGVDDYVPAPDGGAQGGQGAAGGAGGATASSVESSSGSGGAGGAGGATGGAGGGCGHAGGGGAGASGNCPVGMLKVAFMDGSPYCIDRTEVTRADYKAWLDTNCPPNQPPECDWNKSFEPVLQVTDCKAALHALDVTPEKPVVCIDWCDARAYCTGVGKRLCGNRMGNKLPFSSWADVDASEWYNACTEQGLRVFPYGDVYEPLTCVGDDYDMVPGDGALDDAVAAGSVTSCKVGMEQLFDMSGNVWEWENSCDANTGPDDMCRHRGGSFWDPEADLRCDGGNPASVRGRSKFNKNVGIRCCADVNP